MICDIATIRATRALVPAVAALVLATACQSVSHSGLSFEKSPDQAPAHSRKPTPPSPKHVFVIVLENTSYQRALAQPYLSSLASQYAVASNYHAVGLPSLPNYLAMTSGSTWSVHDDGYYRLPATGLGNQLSAAGVTWKAYFEGFTGDCFNSPYPYALKHNPFPYYGGQCPANIVPMSELATDLDSGTPRLSWITPGLCNDGHDCPISTADKWLSQVVPMITGSKAWRQDGALFITWDEGDSADDRVALLAIAPGIQREITMPLDHYSLLATIEDALGVPRMGRAKQATSLIHQLQTKATG